MERGCLRQHFFYAGGLSAAYLPLGKERIRSAEFYVDPFAPLLSAVFVSVESRSCPASRNRVCIVHAARAVGRRAVDCSSARESCHRPRTRAARALLRALKPDLRFPQIGLVVSSWSAVYRCLPPGSSTPLSRECRGGRHRAHPGACLLLEYRSSRWHESFSA